MMYDVESARQRDGEAAHNRSDRVEEILNGPRLGHGEGDPLVGEDYSSYPDRPEDLTTVDARQFVTELFEHDRVGSIRDAVEETTPATGDRHIVDEWREAFERATELFDVGMPEGESERDDHRLAELTAEFPEDMRSPSNPLVVSHLYADLGLSTEEIATVFRDDSDTRVKPSQIRRVLRNTGLVRANEGEDDKPSLRLGGTTMDFRHRESPDSEGNSGVNINTEAVARDPNISVERDG